MGHVLKESTNPNIYEIRYRGDNQPSSTIIAQSRGKAMYNCFLNADGIFESFKQFLSSVKSCKKVGYAAMEMSTFQQTCWNRDIPFAEIGMHVRIGNRDGTIVGVNSSANLDVLFDGESVPRNCHPHHYITYFTNSGKVLRCYPSE